MSRRTAKVESEPPIDVECEVCVDSLSSAVAALSLGVSRLELCSSLFQGGLTPSMGLVMSICRYLQETETGNQQAEVLKRKKPSSVSQITPRERPISLFIMIRSRPGSDFDYSEWDMRTMLADIEAFQGKMSIEAAAKKTVEKETKDGISREALLLQKYVRGFVFGALVAPTTIPPTTTQSAVAKFRSVNEAALRRVLQVVHPSLEVTFHRAIDALYDSRSAATAQPTLEESTAAMQAAIEAIHRVNIPSTAKGGQKSTAAKVRTILSSALFELGDPATQAATLSLSQYALKHGINLMVGGGVTAEKIPKILNQLHEAAKSTQGTSTSSANKPLRIHFSAKAPFPEGIAAEDRCVDVDPSSLGKLLSAVSDWQRKVATKGADLQSTQTFLSNAEVLATVIEFAVNNVNPSVTPASLRWLLELRKVCRSWRVSVAVFVERMIDRHHMIEDVSTLAPYCTKSTSAAIDGRLELDEESDDGEDDEDPTLANLEVDAPDPTVRLPWKRIMCWNAEKGHFRVALVSLPFMTSNFFRRHRGIYTIGLTSSELHYLVEEFRWESTEANNHCTYTSSIEPATTDPQQQSALKFRMKGLLSFASLTLENHCLAESSHPEADYRDLGYWLCPRIRSFNVAGSRTGVNLEDVREEGTAHDVMFREMFRAAQQRRAEWALALPQNGAEMASSGGSHLPLTSFACYSVLISEATLDLLSLNCPQLKEFIVGRNVLLSPTDEGKENASLLNLARGCPHLQTVDVSSVPIPSPTFAKLLKSWTNLQLLNLSYTTRFEDTLEELFNECFSPTLKVLRLDGTHGVTKGALMQVATRFPHLRQLSLLYQDSHMTTDPDFLNALASNCKLLSGLNLNSGLQDSGSLQPHLEGILSNGLKELRLTQLSIPADHLTTLFAVAKSLRMLDLEGSFLLTDDNLATLAQHCRELSTLHLDGCRNVTNRGIQLLGELQLPLETLSLRSLRRITDDGLMAYLKKNTRANKLSVLNVSFTYLTERSLLLVPETCPNLTSFVVTTCTWRLLKALGTRCPQLTRFESQVEELELNWKGKTTGATGAGAGSGAPDLNNSAVVDVPPFEAALRDLVSNCPRLRAITMMNGATKFPRVTQLLNYRGIEVKSEEFGIPSD
jgi:copper homeostasis protein CutC